MISQQTSFNTQQLKEREYQDPFKPQPMKTATLTRFFFPSAAEIRWVIKFLFGQEPKNIINIIFKSKRDDFLIVWSDSKSIPDGFDQSKHFLDSLNNIFLRKKILISCRWWFAHHATSNYSSRVCNLALRNSNSPNTNFDVGDLLPECIFIKHLCGQFDSNAHELKSANGKK